MSQSLSDFQRRIRIRAASIARSTDAAVRKVALAVDQAVVMATPVDTGRARANWIVSLGQAGGTVIEAYAPGEGGNTAGANTQAALAQGGSVIAGYQGGRNHQIHITNNLPYIQRLNDGWSTQAPANFVERAVQDGVTALGSAKIVDGS